jgi:hypothetical protein
VPESDTRSSGRSRPEGVRARRRSEMTAWMTGQWWIDRVWVSSKGVGAELVLPFVTLKLTFW